MNNISAALPHPPVALLLDFDGVILQSVQIKIDAFLTIYADADDDERAAILDYQREHGGVTRRLKFRYIEKHIFGRTIDDARVEALSDAYTKLVHGAVLACPFVPGAEAFLSRVVEHAAMHLVSGTPHDELIDIVRRRHLERYFASVHGAPETKPDAFAQILKERGYAPERVLAVGDSTTEFHAGRALGVPFLAIVAANERSPFPPGIATVPTLEGVAALLGFD